MSFNLYGQAPSAIPEAAIRQEAQEIEHDEDVHAFEDAVKEVSMRGNNPVVAANERMLVDNENAVVGATNDSISPHPSIKRFYRFALINIFIGFMLALILGSVSQT